MIIILVLINAKWNNVTCILDPIINNKILENAI